MKEGEVIPEGTYRAQPDPGEKDLTTDDLVELARVVFDPKQVKQLTH